MSEGDLDSSIQDYMLFGSGFPAGEIRVPVQGAISRSLSYESLYRNQERPMVFRQTSCPSPQSETNSFDEEQQRDFEYAMELQRQLNHEIFMAEEDFARYLDNSQRQTLSPPEYSSRRTEFFHPRAEEMINLNPQRMQQRQQHSNRLRRRHRSETSTNRDGQSNREPNPEDMISPHENISVHTLHSHETSQGNLQQRGSVAGANVADSGIPVGSGFQSVRQRSRRASNRDRPMPHRFDQGPVERVERIPGQCAQINPSVITRLTWDYQEDRRRREKRRRQLEARRWEYQPQHWRTGFDLFPTEDYPSLDVHPSYYDPDEVFEIEDGEQYASITSIMKRTPGQSAQIGPNVITPLTWNYQEDRRQREERRRQLEARHCEHQHHDQLQNWRTGFDLLPTEDYPSLDVDPSYYDPDEVFEIEDGEQYVSITQDPFTLTRFLMTRGPTFEMPDQDSNN